MTDEEPEKLPEGGVYVQLGNDTITINGKDCKELVTALDDLTEKLHLSAAEAIAFQAYLLAFQAAQLDLAQGGGMAAIATASRMMGVAYQGYRTANEPSPGETVQ